MNFSEDEFHKTLRKLSVKPLWLGNLTPPKTAGASRRVLLASRVKELSSSTALAQRVAEKIRSGTDDTLLTNEEAAAFLNRSTRSLEKWRGESRGPKFCKVERNIVYPLGELRKYLARRKHGSTSEYPEIDDE